MQLSVRIRLQLLARIIGKELSKRVQRILLFVHVVILWRIWHPSYGVIYDEEERLKSGYYERDQRGRDPDVGDIRQPIITIIVARIADMKPK
jgi:hypothetical protein